MASHSYRIDGQALSDDSGDIHASYGIETDTAVVVRPDGYIARITTPDRLHDGNSLLAL